MKPTLKQIEYYLFIEWLATPLYQRREKRLPETQAEFASEQNVDESTLSRWKHDPNFKEDLFRACQRWAGDKTPNVNMGLYAKACKGDPAAVKLWYQIFEGFSEKTKVEHEGEVTQTLNINIREEKHIEILNAFVNFGLIEPPQDGDTNINTNSDPANLDVQSGNGDDQNAGEPTPVAQNGVKDPAGV